MKVNYSKKYLYSLLVYSPVLVLFSLILMIYLSYTFNYCLKLMTQSTNPEDSFFNISFFVSSNEKKGKFLLFLVSTSTISMILNMLRVIVSDPGYFPSPIDLEQKIVESQSMIISELTLRIKEINGEGKGSEEDEDYRERIVGFLQKRVDFLKNLSLVLENHPLSAKENEKISSKVNYFLNEKPCNDHGYNTSFTSISNEDSLVFNSNLKPDRRFFLSKSSKITKEDEVLIESFIGIDLSKAVLCSTCLRLKVERSHHCRLCGKCVLKMDHHCPWLANCIGFGNYKFFLLVQIYGFLSSFTVLLTYWERIIYDFTLESSILLTWFNLFVYLCNFGLFVFLTWLISINWRLVFKNLTVIENSDKERFPTSRALNIYDLGYYKNFTCVFGSNPLTWVLPIRPEIEGNGIVFQNIYKLRGLDELDDYI